MNAKNHSNFSPVSDYKIGLDVVNFAKKTASV